MRTITVLYTTATGHTEFVIDTVLDVFTKQLPGTRVVKKRAENATPEDLTNADALLLACGSWNTNNVEGQLSPYMEDLLSGRAAKVELQGKPAAAIGLGDERYYYTARAADKLTEYLTLRGATLIVPTLKIINDPFDQAPKIQTWAKEFVSAFKGI
jgi:flavodoxin